MTPLERAAYGLNWQADHQRRVAVICDALTDYLSNKAGGPGGGDADMCGGVALFLSAYIRHWADVAAEDAKHAEAGA
ncbi:MAG: hypothetical protein ABF976_12430 [Acetobacter syzygii]|uniref:hypothetical protein n=1 Tax=Acetobacter syzygii TaxID=146476 RepID=UPI0039E85752